MRPTEPEGACRHMCATSDHERPRRRNRGEDGFTLVEVVVASVVLLLVLVPASALLSSSGGFVTESKAQSEASHLASGLLEQDRASAVSSNYWSGTPTSPSLVDTSATTQTVGGLTFTLSQVGGWCGESSGSWGNYDDSRSVPAEVAYLVVATVTWQKGGHSVVMTTLLSTPQYVVPPSSSTSCPI